MHPHKSFAKDRIIWSLIMVLAVVIAFALLKRDASRSFGSLSYGAFAAFHNPTTQGKLFSEHDLKGHVWVVHAGLDQGKAQQVLRDLITLSQKSASGRRRLHVLTFWDKALAPFLPLNEVHFIIPLERAGIEKLYDRLGPLSDDYIVLVDQNGIIRGKYQVSSSESKRALQNDVLGLL